MQKFVVLIVFLGLLSLPLVQPVYAADKYPDYPVRPAGEYAVTAEKGGLIIGVEPVEDLKDQKTYFKMELTPEGFLPVFIVIQNGSSVDSFLLDKANIQSAGVSNKSTPDVGPSGAVALAPFGVIAWSRSLRAQQNFMKKALASQTLSPGTSAHGFLYIPVPTKGPREKIHLQVPISKSGTSEAFVFNLFF